MPGSGAATLSGDLLESSSNELGPQTRSYCWLQRAIQSQPVPKPPVVGNLEGRYSAQTLVDVQGLWLSNPVFETAEGMSKLSLLGS